MIILRKRRIFLVLCALFVSFSVYFATSGGNQLNTTNRNYDVTQVSSIPATRKSCYY